MPRAARMSLAGTSISDLACGAPQIELSLFNIGLHHDQISTPSHPQDRRDRCDWRPGSRARRRAVHARDVVAGALSEDCCGSERPLTADEDTQHPDVASARGGKGVPAPPRREVYQESR